MTNNLFLPLSYADLSDILLCMPQMVLYFTVDLVVQININIIGFFSKVKMGKLYSNTFP